MGRSALVAFALVSGCAEAALPGALGDGGEEGVPLVFEPGHAHRVVVKFRDEVRARATEDGKVDMASSADAAAVGALKADLGVSFSPLLGLEEHTFTEMRERAEASSGASQPDLGGFTVVETGKADRSDLVETVRAFRQHDTVEYAYVEPLKIPPPGDIDPPTDDFEPEQGYLEALGIEAARDFGATGAGVRFADCEYGWNLEHEDLEDAGIVPEPGQTSSRFVEERGFDAHGTAVLGEISGQENGFGVSGIAPDAEVRVFPEHTQEEGARRAEAVAEAIASSRAGDVVLLEMQMSGPGGGYGPAEIDPAIWTLVKNATDSGIIVVAAAGNGAQNLDGSAYAEYRERGDSGAILVGAGASDGSGERLDFSTYGQRVDIHGWGENVTTTGYGDLAELGGDKDQRYTAEFGGTSSASPIVAGAAVLVQSHAREELGRPLTPAEMRDLLIRTGSAQADDGTNIGPFPDLRSALEEVESFEPEPDPEPDPDPETARVLLSQVAYDTPGNDSREEFVELYNPRDTPLSLEGWALADNAGAFTLPEGIEIPAGGYVTLARDEAGFSELFGQAPTVSGMTLSLSNRGDELALVDPEGGTEDFVAWEGYTEGWELEADTGDALFRFEDSAERDSPAAWHLGAAAPASPDS